MWIKAHRYLVCMKDPLKSEAVLFTLKNLDAFPQLIFDNALIKLVEYHKHLSITFNNNGQWHTHIDHIANTAPKKKLSTL